MDNNGGRFDNHTSTSIFLFSLVDFVVLTTLFLPEWIVTHVGGDVQIGLWKTCVYDRKRVAKCFWFTPPNPWKVAIVFIVLGCLFNTSAVIMFVISLRNPSYKRHGQWLGIFTLLCFSIAALAIPIGFSMDQIKGEFFQLPSSFSAGQSFILFNMSVWLTAISEMFAARLCFFNF